MSIKITQYLKDFIESNDKNLSNSQLADLILLQDKEISNKYTKTQLCKLLWGLKNNNKTYSTTNQPKELKTPYKVIGSKHYFYPLKGEFNLPNEIVDELFYSYSKHGLDLSSTEMLLKYNLEPWQWHAVKNALRLYKASHIFSPYKVENTSPDDMKNIIKEKMDEKINTVGFRVEQEYHNSLFRKFKEVISKDTLRDLEVKTIINELADLLPSITITKTEKCCSSINNSTFKEINVVIADIHFGAQNNPDNRHLPTLNVDVIKDKFFNEIIPLINSHKADKVNLFLAGDLIESFSGLNHIDSWKGIQSGYHGAKLIKECYQFLTEFIINIDNISKVIGISGNHDRASGNKQEDTDGLIADVIFEFLKLTLKDQNIQVIFDNKLTNLEIDDIVYIMSHGHEKMTDNASQLVLKYGNQYKFNVLLSGHWHERKIKNDTEILRHIVCPSIFPGNNFSVSLGYSTTPGFLIIENNKKGKPIVHDYSV